MSDIENNGTPSYAEKDSTNRNDNSTLIDLIKNLQADTMAKPQLFPIQAQ